MSTLRVDNLRGQTADGTNRYVVQVVNGRVSDDRATTTSTSFVQLGDTLSITPSFSTSKIYLLATINAELTDAHTAYLDFGRDSTQNLSGVSGGISTFYQSSWCTNSIALLDTPNTTSSVSYFISAKVSGGTLKFNDNSANNFTNFTLMEIAQ